MSIEKAKQAVATAVYEVSLARIGVGQGPGASELASAAERVAEAEKDVQAAERAQVASRKAGEELAPPDEPT